eukprot:snap_masked-scaffold_8-processed-gene-4.33-mRNA-1 protein AED:1.00 eAED:1.00 QI:0/0/0/0/1/1/2/0/96
MTNSLPIFRGLRKLQEEDSPEEDEPIPCIRWYAERSNQKRTGLQIDAFGNPVSDLTVATVYDPNDEGGVEHVVEGQLSRLSRTESGNDLPVASHIE